MASFDEVDWAIHDAIGNSERAYKLSLAVWFYLRGDKSSPPAADMEMADFVDGMFKSHPIPEHIRRIITESVRGYTGGDWRHDAEMAYGLFCADRANPPRRFG
jgi:hypothetical protein